MLSHSRLLTILLCACCLAVSLVAQSDDPNASNALSSPTSESIQWGPLLEQSLFFAAVEHGFRVATEPSTRDRLSGKFFPDWGRSIGNIHGWSDGDNFLTNYVGHPMEGAVTGYLFIQNAPRYRALKFGRNREYWNSRAAAATFAFVSSELFELGPLSEASIGNAQSYFPQLGLADHVVTPVVGLAWMIGEDWLDERVVRTIEAHTSNPYWKMIARSALNPARSMANAVRLKTPWSRDDRPGLFGGRGALLTAGAETSSGDSATGVAAHYLEPGLGDLSDGAAARWELATTYSYTQLAAAKPGTLACNGGGATVTYNLNSWAGITADVGGCAMKSPGLNVSGDSTTYMLGPRFTFRNRTRWSPFAEFLAGGDKLTTETMFPQLKPAGAGPVSEENRAALHESFTQQQQTNSFALELGAGLDYSVNRPLAVRILDVEDIHTWARSLNGTHYPNNLRFSTGVELRFGNW